MEAITMIEGVSLRGRAATRRAYALPWAHAAECDCGPEHTFTCGRCGRRFGHCLGASDNMPEACDFCWRTDEARAPSSPLCPHGRRRPSERCLSCESTEGA